MLVAGDVSKNSFITVEEGGEINRGKNKWEVRKRKFIGLWGTERAKKIRQ